MNMLLWDWQPATC